MKLRIHKAVQKDGENQILTKYLRLRFLEQSWAQSGIRYIKPKKIKIKYEMWKPVDVAPTEY